MNDYNPAVGLPEGVDSAMAGPFERLFEHPAELRLRGGRASWLGSLPSGAAAIPHGT